MLVVSVIIVVVGPIDIITAVIFIFVVTSLQETNEKRQKWEPEIYTLICAMV